MKLEHLEERVNEYNNSIQNLLDKRLLWQRETKNLILNTLHRVVNTYPIGWKVQHLNWIHTTEAVNITFESFPEKFADKSAQLPAFNLLPGGALIFSQLYNGDIDIIVVFPLTENWMPAEKDIVELGIYSPSEITESLILEKVGEFIKDFIKWEIPTPRSKPGYKSYDIIPPGP